MIHIHAGISLPVARPITKPMLAKKPAIVAIRTTEMSHCVFRR